MALLTDFISSGNPDNHFRVYIAACLLVILAWTLFKIFSRVYPSGVSPRQSIKSSEKLPLYRNGNPPRDFGHWVPLDFKRPSAQPYPGWSIETTKPLPYRPFKWGKYHITMGIRSMSWDEWIEIDNRYLEYHSIRAKRLAQRNELVATTAPEAYPAAIEMLEQMADYLPQRYPTLFRKTDVGLDNIVTGESFNITGQPLAEDPMALASRLIQDDLAIMIEKEDGQYYLLAGAILVPGFWRLKDKFGKSIREIHGEGRGVPGFHTKLKKGMENFFKRLTPDKPVIRHNYFFQVDDGLAWSSSIGSEDGVEEGSFGWFSAEKNRAIEHHHFRSERQTLLRLPRTGGIVFTIHTYFEKVTDIAQEPGVPGRLASAIRGWDDDVSRYKGKDMYVDVLQEYLDNKHAEQKAAGVAVDDEEHEGYPY